MIPYKYWLLSCALFGVALIWFSDKNVYSDALKLASLILVIFPPKFVEKVSDNKTNQKKHT